MTNELFAAIRRHIDTPARPRAMVDSAMAASFAPQLHILPHSHASPVGRASHTAAAVLPYMGALPSLCISDIGVSVDFDFFAAAPIDPMALMRDIPFLADAKGGATRQEHIDCRRRSQWSGQTLVLRPAPSRPDRTAASRIGHRHEDRLAHRPRRNQSGRRPATLGSQGLSRFRRHAEQPASRCRTRSPAAVVLFGRTFNPQITLKALSYFGDERSPFAAGRSSPPHRSIRFPNRPGSAACPSLRSGGTMKSLPQIPDLAAVARNTVWFKTPAEAIGRSLSPHRPRPSPTAMPEDVAILRRYVTDAELREGPRPRSRRRLRRPLVELLESDPRPLPRPPTCHGAGWDEGHDGRDVNSRLQY